MRWCVRACLRRKGVAIVCPNLSALLFGRGEGKENGAECAVWRLLGPRVGFGIRLRVLWRRAHV